MGSDYFFGLGGVAMLPFWLGWAALVFGGCSFLVFPLLSFIAIVSLWCPEER